MLNVLKNGVVWKNVRKLVKRRRTKMANVMRPRPSNRCSASITLSTAADGVSEVIDLTGLVLSAVQISSSWTTAALGFRCASLNGSTDFYPVKDSLGNFLTFATSASQVLVFDPAQFAALQKIQLVSMTTAGVAVAQNSARSLVLGLSPAYT